MSWYHVAICSGVIRERQIYDPSARAQFSLLFSRVQAASGVNKQIQIRLLICKTFFMFNILTL